MGRLLPVALAAALAAGAGSAPAFGQCRLCDKPTTVLNSDSGENEVSLEVESSIDFDRIVMLGTGQGTAVLRPDGSYSTAGSIGQMSARAMVGTATVHGEPGRIVRIELPRRIELYSLSGSRITFDDVASDLPKMPRLDPTGSLTFHFGGRLTITGDAEGEYRGDLPIEAEYL